MQFDAVKERFKQFNIPTLFQRPLIDKVVSTLLPDEDIIQASTSSLDSKPGYIIITNKRVLFIYKAAWMYNISDIYYNSITSVDAEANYFMGKLKINTPGKQYVFESIPINKPNELSTTIRSVLDAPTQK
jgi:hypothetical protein